MNLSKCFRNCIIFSELYDIAIDLFINYYPFITTMTTFLLRRKEGQSLAEMREKRDMEDAKLLAEERRRQKIEDQKARRAVLDKIKQDRFISKSQCTSGRYLFAYGYILVTRRGLIIDCTVSQY